MQSNDSIETYAYETNKDLRCKEEEIKRINIIKKYKNVTKEDIKKHNPNWPEILKNLDRILIAGACGSEKKCFT